MPDAAMLLEVYCNLNRIIIPCKHVYPRNNSYGQGENLLCCSWKTQTRSIETQTRSIEELQSADSPYQQPEGDGVPHVCPAYQ